MNKWINIKDKLPNDNQECLVAVECAPPYGYELATYDYIKKEFISWGTINRNVTHWMRLPKPPKNKSCDECKNELVACVCMNEDENELS